jgi:hypothetical protein
MTSVIDYTLYYGIDNYWNRDNSVGIAMAYGLDDLGSIPGRGKRSLFISSV